MFRVVATETIQVSAGRAKILPTDNSHSKRQLFHLNAVFESVEKFQYNQDLSISKMLFDLSQDVIPIVFNKMTRPNKTIYKNTNLGSSELVFEDSSNNISKAPGNRNITRKKEASLPANKVTKKYDLPAVIDSIDFDIKQKYLRQFTGLVREFTCVFLSSEWDLGQCETLVHRFGVYPASKQVKIPNRRMLLHYEDNLQSKNNVFPKKDLISPFVALVVL